MTVEDVKEEVKMQTDEPQLKRKKTKRGKKTPASAKGPKACFLTELGGHCLLQVPPRL